MTQTGLASEPSSHSGRYGWLPVALLLFVHAMLLGWAARRNSPTWDEPAHLVAGISHWQLGRFDLYRVNPPLVRMVAAIPVLGVPVDWGKYDPRPGVRPEWGVQSRFMMDQKQSIFRLHTLARWACIPWSVLGGYFCSRWARELYGPSAGILALLLWCFEPNILGHGQLITPDVGATAMSLAAMYGFWRWLRRPAWGRALTAGVLLGLALLTKMTCLILCFLLPVLWIVVRWPLRKGLARGTRLREGGQLGVVLLLALYVLNVGYGFEGSFQRLEDYGFVTETLGGPPPDDATQLVRNRFEGTWVGKLPVPVPRNYLMGMDLQKWDFERKKWSYLRGQWRLGGWWYYYLYALAIKVPLGTWGLVLVSVFVGLSIRGYASSWGDELVLLAPAVAVLALVSSQTGFNDHMRYVLPAFPFVFISVSKVARAIHLRHRKIVVLAGGLLAWSGFSSLWVYPHSLSYFNELAGGPTGGHAHLLGSNIDWGQDLLFLKRWLSDHPEAQPVGLAVFGLPDPEIVGRRYGRPPIGPADQRSQGRSPEETGPLPGWYALSISEIRSYNKRYEYFLRLRPVAMAGYSIYIYHVTLDEANRVRAELGLPLLPEDHREITSEEADGLVTGHPR